MTRTLRCIIILQIVQIVARGTDLLYSSPYGAWMPKDVGGAEAMVWGIACLIAAGVVLVGLISRHPAITVYGCLTGFAVYTMFAVFVFDDTIIPPPPRDWRFFADHVVVAGIWLVSAVSISFRHGVYKILRREEAKDGLG